MPREKHFMLSEPQKAALLSLANQHANNDCFYKDSNHMAKKLLPDVKAILPKAIVDAIDEMKQGRGAELITIANLPVDQNLPADECLSTRVANKGRVSETCLLGINALLEGRFQEEESSHQLGFIHQVTPLKKWSAEASGRGAGAIPFHAENMFIKKPPSILSLFCLQGEAGVETEYLYIKDIIQYLDADTQEQLKKPIYDIVTGDGFSQKKLASSPILEEFENGWKVCRFYEEDRLFSADVKGQQAIASLHKAITEGKDNCTQSVELKAGTLLIFSNAVRKEVYGGLMHGRKGSMAVAKPAEKAVSPRWLQRVCIELSYH